MLEKINTKTDLAVAKRKRKMLKESLDNVRSYLTPCFIDASQYERFVDFKMEALCIADAEISYAENMFQRIEGLDY